MDKTKNDITLDYKLSQIIDYKFEVYETSDSFEKFSAKNNLEVGLSFFPNLEDKQLICEVLIKAFHPNDENDDEDIQTFFNIVERLIFYIPNIDNFISNNLVDLPREFLITLASISYSTTRGILHSKLASYRYKDAFLLPIIEPTKLVTEDYKIFIPNNSDLN